MAGAVNYRGALLREFAAALRGRVLEIGAGVGQLSASLAAAPGVDRLLSVEPNPAFCATFRRLHPDLALKEGTIDDVEDPPDWDALVSINVLEHVREDGVELARFRARLAARRGALCLFVPAREELYSPLDADFGHVRRYGRAGLRRRLEDAGFEIERLHYFNWIGYFAWWWNFRLWKRRRFDPGAVAWFDRYVFPVVNACERRVARPPFGQSLVAVARARR
jgi:SAM-dependent methyltransferase